MHAFQLDPTDCRLSIDERGSATPELVIIFPLVMTLLLLAIQLALWSLASQAMTAAISAAGGVLRSQSGSLSQARSEARLELSLLASGLVIQAKIRVSALPSGQELIEGVGRVPSLLPGVTLYVGSTSIGSPQRFRASG